MNDVNFQDVEAPVAHQLRDAIYSSDDPTDPATFTVTLAAAELDQMTHVELRLSRRRGAESILLRCWEGVTSEADPPSEWGASLAQSPEMVAEVIRLVLLA